MALNNNSDTSNEIRDVLKIQVGKEGIPSQYQNYIVPVVDVNPKHARVIDIIKTATKTTTGTATLYTTPANEDFYLYAFGLQQFSNSSSDNTSLTLSAVINGETINLISFVKQSLLSSSGTINYNLPFPIKLDRNSNILYGSTFTAGAVSISVSIFGFVDRISKS